MKKHNVALATLAAFAAFGTPQTLPAQNNAPVSQNQRHNEAVEKTPVTVRQGKATALNPTGGLDIEFLKVGNPPKQYGQWLQSTGRQKWTKKSK